MDSNVRSHRDLIAWQRAFQLGMDIYRATEAFLKQEMYGLTSQLRRGVVSVSINIAEGNGRGRQADYLRFLRMARGALYELDTELLFAVQLGMLDAEGHQYLQKSTDECGRVLAGLIRSIANTKPSA